MTQDYPKPITPPPELVQQWWEESNHRQYTGSEAEEYVVSMAAQYGADQELEACCHRFARDLRESLALELRAARRPKPPSLKERALQAWAAVEAGTDDQTAMAVIRRALEALPDD
jgi:hypothetical protein